MNKAELVGWLQEKNEDQFPSKAQAERALAAVIDGIKGGLTSKPNKVQLVGFGTFEVRDRKARTGRNPQTGETLKIPASKTVTFRPGKTLKASLTAKKKRR
ncbi:HU family DNA-binding protein [Planctomycetota bacterium]